MDKDNFVFEDWCKEYELNEDTAKALVERGHRSHLSVSVMVIEDIKKDFKKLLPAQILLLERAVSDFHKANETQARGSSSQNDTTVTMPSTSHALTAKEAVAPNSNQEAVSVEEILRQCGLSSSSVQPTTGNDLDIATDPYGFGEGPYSNKLREIGNFVTFHQAGKTDDEDPCISIGGVRFRTSAQTKLAPSKINPHHYMEGSLAILREMILRDSMPPARVLDHLNYLIQIARFGQVFPWQAVLKYDAVYRKQQHEVGFRWGTSSPTLMQTHLNGPEKLPLSTGKQRQQIRDPQTGQIICHRWNSVAGCPLYACKFLHACRVCFSKDHPQHSHATPNPKSIQKNH